MYTGKQYEAVISMYSSTLLSTREVAKRTGVGRQTVHDWVKKAGLSRTANQSREITKEMREECIRLYNEGLSGHKVAKRTGVSRNSVIRIVESAGVKRMKGINQSINSRKYKPEQRAVCAIMRRSGYTYKEISQTTGIPMGSIHNLITTYEEAEKKSKRKVRI